MTRKPGPTGDYPQGKLNRKDRGALAIAMRVETLDGQPKLVIDFGTDLSWFAMDKAMATALIAVLLRFVKEGR